MLWFQIFAGPLFFGFLHYNFGQRDWLLHLVGGDPVMGYLFTLAVYYVVIGSFWLFRLLQIRRQQKFLNNW